MEPVALRYLITRGYIVKMTWIATMWALVIVTVLAIIGLSFGLATPDAGAPPDLGILLPGVLLLPAVWLGLPLWMLWNMRTLVGQSVDLAFNDEGMRQDGLGHHVQGDWSVVTGATRRGPFLLVKMRAGGTLGIPTAAFNSPAQAAGLLAMLRTHIAANKAQAAAKV